MSSIIFSLVAGEPMAAPARWIVREIHMTLSGQKIVILGGTSGLGFATAAAAAREGAAVVVVSSRRKRVERALANLPDGAEGHAADLADEEQQRALFDRIGAFDHLVFTAGESLRLGALDALSLDEARRAFELRFWGALAAAKHGSRRIRPGGSIVLTTGIAMDRPQRGWTVAASICGATAALTRALAVELAPIRVNAVSPGVVRTALWDNFAETDREALYRDVGRALPVGRVGEPEDLAEAYLYHMRERFSTGQVVTVDGGTVLV
jgi:NAD(P)-dependent dehydrogenase (short-subunit alcohol dehydrogenase family)